MRTLRQQWGVDEHPGTRAGADGIIADLATGELTRPRIHASETGPSASDETSEPSLF
ncbi:hypothetical protein [Nocardia sp. NPDC024068]|uniref:hypothetical protein n=1 Tax=Nocardia sp. NPDC024068 TaxID=3157197 RepID=UPI0033EB564C